MIFVTVGTQVAFDRLVLEVDEWAARSGADVLAQIGPEGREPRAIRWVRRLDPPAFRRAIADARAVVAHAGMGTILTALELGRPTVVMPRRANLREHRSDHQIATARRLAERGLVRVVSDAAELARALDEIDLFEPPPPIPPVASDGIVEAIRSVLGEVGERR